MEIKAPFKLSDSYSEKCLKLLSRTSLGTSGAKYKHLDTKEIIETLENPLFLSLERNNSPIANITFCRRKKNWYIRYFAFDSIFQSKNPKIRSKPSKLKEELNLFFSNKIKEGINFYAYIDPKNQRSKQMAATFGFNKITELKTYSFSRLKPKKSKFLSEMKDLIEIDELNSRFKNEHFYFRNDLKRAKIYVLKDSSNMIIASARLQQANWEILNLPGKFGKIFVSLIPHIPIINKLINPKHHSYLVADMLFFDEEINPNLINQFFEGILQVENRNVLMLWEDGSGFFQKNAPNIKWGLFKFLIGNPQVDIVYNGAFLDKKKKFFVSAIDLI